MRSFDSDDENDEPDNLSQHDDQILLERIFNVRHAAVLHCFTASLLDVSLLPARVLLTRDTLHVFATLDQAVEARSGHCSVRDLAFIPHRRWLVLEPGDALNLYKSSEPSELYQPLQRVPLSRVARVRPLGAALEIALRSPSESVALQFDSDVDANAWVVALRVAAAAARRRSVKRSVLLSGITSVQSPAADLVFGADCITLTLGSGDAADRLWLSGVSDFDATFARLRDAWLAQLAVDDAPPGGAAAAPRQEHPFQQRFESTFKLRGEPLRDTFVVSLVVNDFGLLTRARISVTDQHFCVRASSIKQLLAIVPWSAVTAIDDAKFLVLDCALNVYVRGGKLLGFVLPPLHSKRIAHRIRALWAENRSLAADDDDLVFDELAGGDAPSPVAAPSHAALFHDARNKQFHEAFGADIPITQVLQDSFRCALLRSDNKHAGELHVTQGWFAFCSSDGFRVVAQRAHVTEVRPSGTSVTLVCGSDADAFVFVDMSRLASFLRFVQEGSEAPAAHAAASADDVSLKFHHSQLESFRSLFALTDEELIDTHSCSLIRSFALPVRGTLFIGRRYVCFEGSLLSAKIVVPLADVAQLTRIKHAFLFQDAIRVTTKAMADGFHFVGFWSVSGTLAQLKHAVAQQARGRLHAADADDNDVADDADADDAERALSEKLHAQSAADAKPPAPMRIVILTIGSRGDVQPTLALGRALQADGHTVTIGTHLEFKQFVEKAGLAHATLAGDPKALMSLCVSNGMFTPSFVREALANFGTFIDELVRSALAVVKSTDAQLIIQAPTVFAGAHISEALGVPLINWFTMPHTPTTRFPHPFAVTSGLGPLGPAYNFLSYLAVQQALWQPLAGQLNAFRAELGLRPLSRVEGPAINDAVPIVYCFSKYLVPKPNDWPAHVHVVGFFFEEQAANAPAYVPPKPLADFLAAGPPPIYVGFGSITGIDDVEAFFAKVLEAIALSKQRCILLTGWAQLGGGKQLPDNILVLESVPHDWLFPQCAAVVHHGGAGTLAAGLRARRPTICVPFFADQFHWGACVADKGAGFSVPAADLTAERLRAAIVAAVSSADMQRKAAALGELIDGEGGVANAKRAIYGILAGGKVESAIVQKVEEPELLK